MTTQFWFSVKLKSLHAWIAQDIAEPDEAPQSIPSSLINRLEYLSDIKSELLYQRSTKDRSRTVGIKSYLFSNEKNLRYEKQTTYPMPSTYKNRKTNFLEKMNEWIHTS